MVLAVLLLYVWLCVQILKEELPGIINKEIDNPSIEAMAATLYAAFIPHKIKIKNNLFQNPETLIRLVRELESNPHDI